MWTWVRPGSEQPTGVSSQDHGASGSGVPTRTPMGAGFMFPVFPEGLGPQKPLLSRRAPPHGYGASISWSWVPARVAGEESEPALRCRICVDGFMNFW